MFAICFWHASRFIAGQPRRWSSVRPHEGIIRFSFSILAYTATDTISLRSLLLALRNCPPFPFCIHRRILACCWEEGAKCDQRGTAKNGCNMLDRGWVVSRRRAIVGFDRSSGNNNSGTRTGRFECGWIANGASIVCIVRLVTRGMCVALVCIVAMMHPPMDREEARYNLPTSIEGRGERVGMGGLEFSSGIFFFFYSFLKGRPTMIGNERLEDESNAC